MLEVFERMKTETFRGATLNDIVGGGNPQDVCQNTRDLLARHADLRPGLKVLEIGCGCGRAAVGLFPELSEKGTYYGIDMIPDLISFARREITTRSANFQFFAVPDKNPLYDDLVGSDLEHLYISDEELNGLNGTIDLAMAFSVFTHLKREEASIMLRQIWQRLAMNGVAVISCYVLDRTSRAAISGGRTDRFKAFAGAATDDVLVDNDDGENSAVGYAIDLWSEMVEEAGFTGISAVQFGSWRGTPGHSYQDILILKKVPAIPLDFDPQLYLGLNPDLKEAGVNPYSHFFNWGRNEGRPWRQGDEPRQV